ISKDPIKRRVQVAVMDRLVQSLGEIKGIPLKAAQLASYMDFNISDEFRENLAKLQTMSEPMPPSTASRVFQKDLGKTPEQVFAEWSPKPFAAASIGQVHRAKLKSGKEVAVKIQYPD